MFLMAHHHRYLLRVARYPAPLLHRPGLLRRIGPALRRLDAEMQLAYDQAHRWWLIGRRCAGRRK